MPFSCTIIFSASSWAIVIVRRASPVKNSLLLLSKSPRINFLVESVMMTSFARVRGKCIWCGDLLGDRPKRDETTKSSTERMSLHGKEYSASRDGSSERPRLRFQFVTCKSCSLKGQIWHNIMDVPVHRPEIYHRLGLHLP